jgi:hypothetical protein
VRRRREQTRRADKRRERYKVREIQGEREREIQGERDTR